MSESFSTEIDAAVGELAARDAAIADGVTSGAFPEAVGRLLRLAELDDNDFALVVNWITRDGIKLEERIQTTVAFLELIFTHPLWSMCEQGAAILALVATKLQYRDLCLKILDRLLEELAQTSRPRELTQWRIILGTSEACFLARHYDQGRNFDRSGMQTRFDHCVRMYFNHENCHIRALLAENSIFLALELRQEPERFQAFLTDITEMIDFWLLDTDIWPLEHVYQLFRVVEELQSTDSGLKKWMSQRQRVVREHPTSLLDMTSKMAGAPWHGLSRAAFLDHLQQIQRRKLKDSPATKS